MDQMALSTPANFANRAPLIAKLEAYAPYMLSILRIMTALLFLEHGSSKLFAFPQPTSLAHPFTLEWVTGVIEFFGGAFAALGLFTRTACFLMSGEMAIGYFMAHAPHSFFPYINRGDSAIQYCFVFLYLVFAGPGPLSIDALWRRSRS
jgi:putative oxidoreductase